MHWLKRDIPRLRAVMVPVLLCGAMLLALPAVASAALSWSNPTAIDPQAAGVALNRVACPSLTQCTAVDGIGHAVTFDPESPHSVTTANVSAHSLSGIACPSTTQCTAVDFNGEETTFDPQSAAGGTPVVVDSTGTPLGLACPTSTQCTTVDANGAVITFNPRAPGSPSNREIDPNGVLISVQCPGGSTTWCVAVDTGGNAIGFDPTGANATEGPTQVDANSSEVAAACSPAPSSTQCAAVDTGGGGAAFKAPPDQEPQQGSSGSVLETNSGPTTPTALSCPTDAECVAVDGRGDESTFDPSSLIFGVAIPVDKGQALSDVACPGENQCTAVDRDGQEVTFNPSSPENPSVAPVDGHTNLSALSCPSAGQCTALDVGGSEVTFDPGSAAAPTRAGIDPAATGVYGVACPSTAQCTTVDNLGDEVTFNPGSPGAPTPIAIVRHHTLYGVACPSVTQCTAVDDGGQEVTFNPRAAGHPSTVALDSGHALLAVACPSTRQCSAVDDRGAEVTFDPQAPGGPVPHLIDRVPDADVACPALTQCTAVDGAGDEVTFNPQAPSEASALAIDSGRQLAAVSCRGVTDCVAVEISGRAVEGDPHLTVRWAARQVSGNSLAAIQCPTLRECVAVDQPGNAVVGSSGPLPPVPRALSGPSVVGQALQGRTLTARRGRWRNPTAFFTYQWQRCDARGRRCGSIAGALGTSYRLTAADVGHRIRVSVTGWNISGSSAPSFSRRTTTIQLSLVVRSTSISGLGRGAPRLVLSLSAGPDGRRITRLTILLPEGLTVRSARGLDVRNGARLGYATRNGPRAITIVLSAPSTAVTVSIGPPELEATARLIRQSGSRRPTELRLQLAVSQNDGSIWRVSLPLT